jgi:hypothetical protein
VRPIGKRGESGAGGARRLAMISADTVASYTVVLDDNGPRGGPRRNSAAGRRILSCKELKWL